MPVNGQFFFGDFTMCDIVIFEEFSWEGFKSNFPQLKRLLEGKAFSVDVKCKCRRDISVTCSVILVSNEEIVDDEGFARRLRVVREKEAFWRGKEFLAEVREEPRNVEVEVFDLCSSS
jgi:hypothetical protein